MSLRSPDLFRAWDDERGHLAVLVNCLGTWRNLCMHCAKEMPQKRKCKG